MFGCYPSMLCQVRATKHWSVSNNIFHSSWLTNSQQWKNITCIDWYNQYDTGNLLIKQGIKGKLDFSRINVPSMKYYSIVFFRDTCLQMSKVQCLQMSTVSSQKCSLFGNMFKNMPKICFLLSIAHSWRYPGARPVFCLAFYTAGGWKIVPICLSPLLPIQQINNFSSVTACRLCRGGNHCW